jgi:D-alanyl-D-alanine carboxypeptidase
MASLSTLDPQLRPWAEYLVRVGEYYGLRIQVTSARRTAAQQASLWNRYQTCQREGGRCLPAAPPGTSDHERGLAFDLVVGGDYHSAAQRWLGQVWQSWGGRWAGNADPVHFSV